MIIVNFIGNEVEKYIRGLDQYDRGQILCISGLDLPKFVEVQFSLQETGGLAERIVGITTDGVTEVEIPNYMLTNNDATSDYEIYAFVYVTNETSAETVYKITMEVNSRPKPNPYDTPEDIGMFNRVIEVMKDSVTAAENAAGTSEKNAQKTGEDRKAIEEMVGTITGIEQQVQDVKEYAGQAKTAAENALLSEQEAKKSEGAALQHRTGAETAENNAELAEQNAKKSEQAVEQTKQLVMQMGQEVLQNKNQVDEKVEAFNKVVTDAVDAIETVKTDAVDDVKDAGTEQTKKVTDEGAKQVKAIEDKGNEVLQSIPQDFTTQMESKLNKQQGSENKGKALVVGEDGNVTVGEVQGGDGIPIINTMSGESPLVVPDSAERVNKGFGLSGKSEQLTTTGKNLWDIGNTIKITGQELFTFKKQIHSGAYTISAEISSTDSDSAKCLLLFYYKDKGSVGKQLTRNNRSSATVIFEKDVESVILYASDSSNNSANDVAIFKNIQIEKGDIATTYEPYTGGKPSPSPEYPQEIKNVGKYNPETQKYEVDVKVTGKNFIRIDDIFVGSPQNTIKCHIEDNIYIKCNKSTAQTSSNQARLSCKFKNGTVIPIYDNGMAEGKIEPGSRNNPIIEISCRSTHMTSGAYSQIQCEFGKVATEYQPYTEQTLTITSDRPITKWDKLVEQDGQIGWLYKSNIIKNFDGDGYDIRLGTQPKDDITQFTIMFTGAKKNGSQLSADLFVDKYNVIALSYTRYEVAVCCNWTDGIKYFSSPQRGIITVEQFKAWLKTNPLTIAYETETTEFVPLQQSEQDAIRVLRTYYPTTVIAADGGSVVPDLEVTYIADTKNYILNREKSTQEQIHQLQSALISQKISGGGITISDSSRLPVEEFSMSGKTVQVQTKGVQILTFANRVDVGDTELGGKKWSGKISEQAYSVWNNYKKATVEFLENNSFKISHVGVGSANGNGLELPIKIKPDTDYTLSYESNISEVLVYVIQMDSECNKLKETSSRNKKYTFHSEANAEWVILKFCSILNSSYIVNNVQFEEGTVATTYEPYTGGKPSPRPDYPQLIEVTSQGTITVNFTDGVNYQTVDLNCPREFTKWDKLQKIDGVWNWVFRTCRYIITGDEEFFAAGEEYTTGSSTNFYTNVVQNAERQANRFMERLRSVNGIWSKINETGFCINAAQLHMRLPNTLLGVSDTTTKEEKKTAYVNYLKAEYKKGTPYSLMYEQVVPEFIPLSQSEQDKLNALTMYAPNTEITNTGGCNMELTYTVDTKSYVDAKIASVVKTVVETQKALL